MRKRVRRASPRPAKRQKGGRALAAATWAILESQPVLPPVDGLIAEEFGPVPVGREDAPAEEHRAAGDEPARIGGDDAAEGRAPAAHAVRRPLSARDPHRSVIECGVARLNKDRLMALHSRFFGRAVDVFVVRCRPPRRTSPFTTSVACSGEQRQASPHTLPW